MFPNTNLQSLAGWASPKSEKLLHTSGRKRKSFRRREQLLWLHELPVFVRIQLKLLLWPWLLLELKIVPQPLTLTTLKKILQMWFLMRQTKLVKHLPPKNLSKNPKREQKPPWQQPQLWPKWNLWMQLQLLPFAGLRVEKPEHITRLLQFIIGFWMRRQLHQEERLFQILPCGHRNISTIAIVLIKNIGKRQDASHPLLKKLAASQTRDKRIGRIASEIHTSLTHVESTNPANAPSAALRDERALPF